MRTCAAAVKRLHCGEAATGGAAKAGWARTGAAGARAHAGTALCVAVCRSMCTVPSHAGLYVDCRHSRVVQSRGTSIRARSREVKQQAVCGAGGLFIVLGKPEDFLIALNRLEGVKAGVKPHRGGAGRFARAGAVMAPKKKPAKPKV